MSYYRATGLSVTFKSPIWYAYQSTIESNNFISTYGHEIAADGGYKSAAITISANIRDIEDWVDRGLGRDVIVYSPEGLVIWNGFVNEIMGNFGFLQVKRGPLMNIANRVSVVYTPYVDITAEEPTTGETTETTIVEDDDSQTRYSIIEAVVNGGTLMDDATYCGDGCVPENEAEELRDAYLAEYKNPETSHTISPSQGGEVSLTLNCLGYIEWLSHYVYNKESDLTVQVPTKIMQVLAADPNSMFSTDYKYISSTASYLVLTPELENQNKMAKSVIDEMVALGDANDNRTLFGIYNDRKAHYSAIPTEVEYQMQVQSRDMKIFSTGQNIVQPWNVSAGKWIRLIDFMPGRVLPSELRLDPRNVFIETVRYDAPYGLQVQGSRVSTVKQLMAKRGVSGA